METRTSASEYKSKAWNYLIESYFSKDSSSTNCSNNSWPEQREHWHDYSKNRNQSSEEWNRDMSSYSRNRDDFGEEGRVQCKQSQQQEQLSYSSYNYNTSNQPIIDKQNHQMISLYDMFAVRNTRCGEDPVDSLPVAENNIPVNSCTGMPLCSDMNVAGTPGSGVNPFMRNYCQYGLINAQDSVMTGAVKEVVYLSKSVLYPPNPNAPPLSTSEKPLGCKTVFIDGLPEKTTEEIIKEVFERCGEILTIRLNKKNFGHIRFANEAFVENAIYFSGYRIKIGNKDEAAFTGELYIDYAKSEEDQCEYESQLCVRQSPPPVVHYSNVKALELMKKLREEDTFLKAVFVLITWLEKGKCSRRNSSLFYSMIQNTNSHVKRLAKKKVEFEQELIKSEQKLMAKKIKYEQELMTKKIKYEEELMEKINKYEQEVMEKKVEYEQELMEKKIEYERELKNSKLLFDQQMQGILFQYNESIKVFDAACLQKVWEQFTKNQRKNIQLWKEQTKEIKNLHVEEILNDRIEDEMDVSDCEDDESIVIKPEYSSFEDENKKYQGQLNELHEEIDSLRCQLEVAQNEMTLLPSETAEERDFKDQQLMVLLTTVRNMKKMLNLPQKRVKDEVDLKEYQAHKRKCLRDDDNKKNNFLTRS